MHRLVPLVLVLGFFAMSGTTFGMQSGPGCGPANYVFEGNKTRAGAVLAALMNLTSFPTQLGAITSGTSGCEPSRGVQNEHELRELIVTAGAGLEQEIANGDGAFLHVLSELIGCPVEAHAAFAAWSQAEYAASRNPGESLESFVFRLRSGIAGHPELGSACRLG